MNDKPLVVTMEAESTIAGEVRFEGTDEIIPVYRVRIEKPGDQAWASPMKSWKGVDDPEGVFVYEGLEAGTYLMEVRAENAAPGLAEVTVKSGEEKFVTIQLTVPGTIRGVVVLEGEEGDVPVSGARVAVIEATAADGGDGSSSGAFGNYLQDRMKEISSRSNGEGEFVLRDVPAGTLTIEASHNEYLPAQTTVTVEVGGEVTCRLVLRTGYTMSGVVNDHEGLPEPERVILLEGPDKIQKLSRSDPEGGWQFNGLKPGNYKLICPTPDLSRDMDPMSVKIEGDHSGVTLTLPPPAEMVDPGEDLPGEDLPVENIPEGVPRDIRR